MTALKIIPLVSVCMAICSITFSQADKFGSTITIDDLKEHLYKIASPEMQGRETATEGQRKAASYIEGHFKQYKLSPGWDSSYQQNFPVYRDSLVNATLTINGTNLKYGDQFSASTCKQSFCNDGVNISIEAKEIVFVGRGRSDATRDDYKTIDAKGKIVVAWPKAQYDEDMLQKAAQKNGAAALIIVRSLSKETSPRLGNMYAHTLMKDSLPNILYMSDKSVKVLFGKKAGAVEKELRAYKNITRAYKVPVNVQLEIQTAVMQSSNVIGVLEGTDLKSEALVITAHYDHLGTRDSVIYYGADDDGSGTVTVLELAQAFSAAADSGMRPRRTIIFMTVSGEEKGLWGSDFYSANPAFPLDSTSANINIDMIGRIEKGRESNPDNYIYVVGDNRLSSDLRPVSESVNSRHHKLNFDYKFNDPNDPERIYYRSDHYNFAKKGVPAIFYFSGLHSDYHRPTDTPDKIRYDLLWTRAQTIFYTAWEIANRDAMLKRDLP